MQSITKALVGTVAAGAMVVASATPALAQNQRNRDGGIDVGDVIAGALIIGGIAAAGGAQQNPRQRAVSAPLIHGLTNSSNTAGVATPGRRGGDQGRAGHAASAVRPSVIKTDTMNAALKPSD